MGFLYYKHRLLVHVCVIHPMHTLSSSFSSFGESLRQVNPRQLIIFYFQNYQFDLPLLVHSFFAVATLLQHLDFSEGTRSGHLSHSQIGTGGRTGTLSADWFLALGILLVEILGGSSLQSKPLKLFNTINVRTYKD